MRYSIVTATLLRDTLARLCGSIDRQTCGNWEHILVVDRVDVPLPDCVFGPQRRHVYSDLPMTAPTWSRANAARRQGSELATGDYVFFIDDDNYLADDRVLETLLDVTEPVALFPILYEGEFSHPLPIRVGRSDSNGLMVERSLARFPLTDRRSSDGEFIVKLTTNQPFEVVEGRPLVVFPSQSYGVA